jgi:hypothetical protein
MLGSSYPVAYLQHFIACKLYASHESKNTVFENKHKYRSHRTQASKKIPDRFFENNRQYQYEADEIAEYFCNLHIAGNVWAVKRNVQTLKT